MPCFTGLNAALFIRAETGPTPTTKVGTEWTEVKEVSDNFDVSLADLSSRASNKRKNCPTLVNYTVEITANYVRGDAIHTILRNAVLNGTLVDAAVLDSGGTNYGGYVGRFAVQSLGNPQPMEEGLEITATLAINDGPTYITA
jgi:hypothetical protein